MDYFVLCKSASEYHELIFGAPLDLAGEDDATIKATVAAIEQYVKVMSSTFAGREVLRAKGWDVKELNKSLAVLADNLSLVRSLNDEDQHIKHRDIH